MSETTNENNKQTIMDHWLIKSLLPMAIVGSLTWTIGIFDEQRKDLEAVKSQLLVIAEQDKSNKAENTAFLAALKDLSHAVASNSKEIAVLSTRLDISVSNNTKAMELLLDKLVKQE